MEVVQFETAIEDLNDFCLLKVFDYLDFIDMVNITFTCKRFCGVSGMLAQNFKSFCMASYVQKMRKRKQQITVLHFDRAMDYIADVVVSITSFNNIHDHTRDFLFKRMTKWYFPKLKSLWIREAKDFDLIKNKNIENLEIANVKSGDLNNYASGITQVKELRFGTIHPLVPISELVQFFDNNPNIKSLLFINKIQRPLTADFFSHLKNLTKLVYHIDINFRDLEYVLQIENLTELTLENRYNGTLVDFLNITVENFLTSMVQKQTLKSIELRSIYFDNIATVLAELNLVSLRYVSPRTSIVFLDRLREISFPTLKYLDILAPVDVTTMITLVKHLTSLEDLQFTMLRPYNRQNFEEQLTQLVAVRVARPELYMYFFAMPLSVKIFFQLGCYEINETNRNLGYWGD